MRKFNGRLASIGKGKNMRSLAKLLTFRSSDANMMYDVSCHDDYYSKQILDCQRFLYLNLDLSPII